MVRLGKVCICGQRITSRTETLEDFFKSQTDFLLVLGLAGIRHSIGSQYKIYKNGLLFEKKPLPSFRSSKTSSWQSIGFIIHYLLSSISILFTTLKVNTRFDYFIGISAFYTLIGILLKRLGLVKHVIFYCLDYYQKGKHSSLVWIKLFERVDRFCANHSDVIWNLSEGLANSRKKKNPGHFLKQKELVAPLTYPKSIKMFKSLSEVRRWSIAFTGTIDRYQGLELVVETMPDLLKKFPNIKVEIIGEGPHIKKIKKLINEYDVADSFIFHGFVKDEKTFYDILSSCAIGIAPYEPLEFSNALHDPGKAKIYAMVGLPVIITKFVNTSKEIISNGAGIGISYNKNDFFKAVQTLLEDDKVLNLYKNNASKYADKISTESIFPSVFKLTEKIIENG